MKKLFAIIIAVTMVVSMVAVLASCDKTEHKCQDRCPICGACTTECEEAACAKKCQTHDMSNPTTVAEKVYAARSLTKEQLEAAAEAEFKAANVDFTAKATTSGVEKALKAFKEDYTWFNFAAFSSSKDKEAYKDMDSTLAKGGYYADMAMIQIASSWQSYIDSYYMLNYIPQNDDEIQLSANATQPLVGLYADKLFAYKKDAAGDVVLKNIWQLTGKDGKTLKKVGGSSLQDPTQEGINMAFLTMLTSEESCTRLAAAYKNYFGEEYKNQKGCKNIGYYFIKEFIGALTDNHDSDSKVLSTYIQQDQKGTVYVVGLNKVKGYKNAKGDKLPWHEDLFYSGVDGDIEGYNGFTYNTYLGIPATSKLPYTACLFARYILTEKGFKAGWKDVGYSSPNAKVQPNSDSAAGVTYSLDVTKVLQEDPAWTTVAGPDVRKFVSSIWKSN